MRIEKEKDPSGRAKCYECGKVIKRNSFRVITTQQGGFYPIIHKYHFKCWNKVKRELKKEFDV